MGYRICRFWKISFWWWISRCLPASAFVDRVSTVQLNSFGILKPWHGQHPLGPLYMNNQATPSSYLATCIPGLATTLAQELEQFPSGISNIAVSGNSAVTFQATREASLRALCWLRTAHRILEFIATSPPNVLLYNRQDLYNFIQQTVFYEPERMEELLGDGQGGLLTISCKVVLNNPRYVPQDLSHSHFTGLTIKNAICDLVRDLRGDRPNVDLDDPDVPLVAIILGQAQAHGTERGGASITLYRSLHPPLSLHKRGYRQNQAIHKAALKESLAAGLLLEAGWTTKVRQHKKPTATSYGKGSPFILVDPMAGSGSLIVEAAMMAADIAPGLMRIKCGVSGQSLPPVTRWKDNHVDTTQLWKQVLLDATKRAKEGLRFIQETQWIQLYANDIHGGALAILEESLTNAGLTDLVTITQRDCYDLQLADDKHPYWVVTNPPWGVRLTEDVVDSWDGLRHFLRDNCPSNTEAWVLSGDRKATTMLKLKRDRMVPIQTGDQDLRWIQYTIRAPEKQHRAHEETNVQLDARTQSRPISSQGSRIESKAQKATKAPPSPRPKTNKNEWLLD